MACLWVIFGVLDHRFLCVLVHKLRLAVAEMSVMSPVYHIRVPIFGEEAIPRFDSHS